MSYELSLEPRSQPWAVDDFRSRLHAVPEKLELIDGKVEATEEELLALLAFALELNGAARAVRIGHPEVWRRAVADL